MAESAAMRVGADEGFDSIVRLEGVQKFFGPSRR